MQDLGLGRRLALAREAAGMTQEVAAPKIGIARETLSVYEQAEPGGREDTNGKRDPRARVLRRICEVYGCSADWLLWGEAPRAEFKGKRHLSALPGGRQEPRPAIQPPLLR
jgi:transcriptional regulator with XRE-family HTH domain